MQHVLKNKLKYSLLVCLSLLLGLSIIDFPQVVLAAESYSVYVDCYGKNCMSATSSNGTYYNALSLSGMSGSGQVIYFKGNNGYRISKVKVYEKVNNVLYNEQTLNVSSSGGDHVWFAPTKGGAYVIYPYAYIKSDTTKYDIDFEASGGGVSTSEDGTYTSIASHRNISINNAVTFYYKGFNNKSISSLKLYKKDDIGDLTLIKTYSDAELDARAHNMWILNEVKSNGSGWYVVKGEFNKANTITLETINITGSLDGWEYNPSLPLKGKSTLKQFTYSDGDPHVINFHSVPSGFGCGSGIKGHETDMKLEVSVDGVTLENQWAIRGLYDGNYGYQYTLPDCRGEVVIKGVAELNATPNVTTITNSDGVSLNDSNIGSKAYHLNKIDAEGTYTYKVEKTIPDLKSGYRFSELYRYVLDISSAVEPIAYRFYSTQNGKKTLLSSNTIKNGVLVSSDRRIVLTKGTVNGLYNNPNYSKLLYWSAWNDNYPWSGWNGMQQFFKTEKDNCKNDLYVFDFKNKANDDLYNCVLTFEVDCKRKEGIDLSADTYEYLGEKHHNFNGGEYYTESQVVLTANQVNVMKKQEGVHGLLKLEYNPALVVDGANELYIQRSRRWDFVRHVFTIFTQNIKTQANGGIVTKINKVDTSTSTIASINSATSITTTVDAAHKYRVYFSANSGKRLKSIILKDELGSVIKTITDSSKINTYANQGYYEFASSEMSQDQDITFNFVNTYTVTAMITYGTPSTILNNGTIGDISTSGNIKTQISIIASGENCIVKYSPINNQYEIASIKVNGISVNTNTYLNQYSFTNITSNQVIEVVYRLKQYKITTSVINGSISDSMIVNSGASAMIQYHPKDSKYVLDYIEVDGNKISTTAYQSSYNFNNVVANHWIKVVYRMNVYKITTSVVNGTITPSLTVNSGSDKTISFSPNDGYYLRSLVVDGVEKIANYVGYENYPNRTYDFHNIVSDHSIKAIYEKNPKITITKMIKKSEVYLESGYPTFIFEIKGVDFRGINRCYHRVITFDPANYISEIMFNSIVLDIPAGKYTIREIDSTRYKTSITSMSNATKINNSSVSIYSDVANGGSNDAKVTFSNIRSDYHNFDHNCFVINHFK